MPWTGMGMRRISQARTLPCSQSGCTVRCEASKPTMQRAAASRHPLTRLPATARSRRRSPAAIPPAREDSARAAIDKRGSMAVGSGEPAAAAVSAVTDKSPVAADTPKGKSKRRAA